MPRDAAGSEGRHFMKAFGPRLFLVLLLATPAFAQRGAPAPVSPEVHSDGRVTFRVAAPNATEVRLTAEFLKTPQALQKDQKGVWSVTVGPAAPEIYGYQLAVNGVVAIRGRVDVPAAAPMFYDVKLVPHGAVDQRWYP